ncbi:hypothetical protein ACFFRR_005838 [Megaselia abdita]
MLISSNIKFTTTTVNDTTISASTPAGTTRTTTTTKLKIRKQKKYKSNNKKCLPQLQRHNHLRQSLQSQNHLFPQHQEHLYDELPNQSDDENDFLNLVPNSNPVKFLFEKFTTNKSANCNKIFLLKLCFLKNQFKKLRTSLESILGNASNSIETQKLNDDYKRGVEIADHIISLLNFHIDYFIIQEQQEDANINVDDINNGNIRIRKRKIG